MSDRAPPSCRHHKPSGQAIVTLNDGFGHRRDVYLGKWKSKESRAEYARVIAEWEAAGRVLAPQRNSDGLSVNELCVRFLLHAKRYYTNGDGKPSREYEDYLLSIAPLKRLYGLTSAEDFGPLALKAVREEMLRTKIKRTGQVGWARGLVNQRIGRVRRIFKWGASEQLVPGSVYTDLCTVEGLLPGHTDARETEPVKPVSVALVRDTLKHVLPTVAAMIELQLATGMRPGEVCIIRGKDLELGGKIWTYRPGQHKTAHRGHQRVISLGPKAQKILRPWLRANLEEYLFSPREAMERFRAEQRANRKTKVQPSQADRSKAKPKKQPGDRYNPRSYAQAIAMACKKNGLAHWHPHQLRHTAGTAIRREFGLDAARAVLGHRTPVVTEVYAELDMGKAAEVALKLG
jgi:integrase